MIPPPMSMNFNLTFRKPADLHIPLSGNKAEIDDAIPAHSAF